MSTLQYVVRYHRRPELSATSELPDMSILSPAPLETVNSSLALPVMFVVVLESGESVSEKENLSTWLGSLLLTSASIPVVDEAVQSVMHVKDADRTEKRCILTLKTAQREPLEGDGEDRDSSTH